jgi:hypothetical protein
MDHEIVSSIDMWESEGGAITMAPPLLRGDPFQVDWAERIRPRVGAEFDRVERAFKAVAKQQAEPKRSRTEGIIAILEEKREEVMNHEDAGYFIRDWQEIHDQVRQMIRKDPRYDALKPRREL